MLSSISAHATLGVVEQIREYIAECQRVLQRSGLKFKVRAPWMNFRRAFFAPLA
jgi:uncharacterized protein YqgV (UPF0045/DUF77 family)